MISSTIVALEGNISSGKSSVLRHLQQMLPPDRFTPIFEPIEQWANVDVASMGEGVRRRENMLKLFYANPRDYAFVFNSYVAATLVDRVRHNPPTYERPHVTMLERSLASIPNVFLPLMLRAGTLNDVQGAALEYIVDIFRTADKQHTPALVYFLHADPITCYRRTMARNRDGESNIPKQYFVELDEMHTLWRNNIDNGVLVENTNAVDPHHAAEHIRDDLTRRGLLCESK